jgi:hypothetical protein
VFVNDGEQVLTCLVFPSEDSRVVDLFGSDESAVVSAFDVWPLTSCWKAENRPAQGARLDGTRSDPVEKKD